MAQQIVGKIPEFSSDASPEEKVLEEVKQPEAETPPEETVTPEPPAEKPADPISDDTIAPSQTVQETESDRAITGLQNERIKLLKEISELKGQRREIKQTKLDHIEKQIDELKDLHPDDVAVVDKVLRAKGYMTKDEYAQMSYQAIKQEEESRFFERYPEYKVENDPDGNNWSLFEGEVARLRELGWQIPTNPRRIAEAMELIHKNIVKVPSGRVVPVAVQKRQIEVASHGAGGTQRPSPSGKTLDTERIAMLRQGGFSDEDIKNMESRLQ